MAFSSLKTHKTQGYELNSLLDFVNHFDKNTKKQVLAAVN